MSLSTTRRGAISRSRIIADAFQAHALANLAVFTNWLSANNVQGYIGEMGWPDDINSATDSMQWNRLGGQWYHAADRANLWVTQWATGEWWHSNDYKLAVYEEAFDNAGVVSTANKQAPVLEAHTSTANYRRGINVAGGEFGGGGHFDSQGTFNYLAGRGIDIIRLPFSWERVQPTAGAALNNTELQRVVDAVTRAGSAGLSVILDVHNYARHNSNILGSTALPQGSVVNLWQRLSATFSANSTVIAYGLMNEPHDLPAIYSPTATLDTWDASVEGWVGAGGAGTSTAHETTIKRTGAGSLKATKTFGAGAQSLRARDNIDGTARDRSTNGLTLSAWVYLPAGNAGTSWQARIEVRDPTTTYALGSRVNLIAGQWVQITYTMSSTLAQSCSYFLVDVIATNANSTASVYIDDFTQGSNLTGVKLWEKESQDTLTAIRTLSDNKLIMVPGYAWSSAASWTTNHPTPWVTDSANNFRYEAHTYFDRDNSGSYVNTYANELAYTIANP